MGKIKRGILGGFSGKVANVIGASWKGIAYMRSQPLSVSQPNTAAQQTQKANFSILVSVAKVLLLKYVQPLMNRTAVRMSGYNLFIRANTGAIDSSGIVVPADVVIAVGNATGGENVGVTGVNGTDEIVVDYDDNSGSGTALANDVSYALTYNADNDELGIQAVSGTRTGGQVATNTETNNSTGDVVHGWLAFKSVDGLKISGTAYATSVIP